MPLPGRSIVGPVPVPLVSADRTHQVFLPIMLIHSPSGGTFILILIPLGAPSNTSTGTSLMPKRYPCRFEWIGNDPALRPARSVSGAAPGVPSVKHLTYARAGWRAALMVRPERQVVRAGYVVSFLLPSQTGRMPFVPMVILRRTRRYVWPSTTQCFPPVERKPDTCKVQRVFTSRELAVAYYLPTALKIC